MVSIALATFNGERFLKSQLNSIFNQTYKDIEVIACDDASTDDTPLILKEYSKKHNLRYFINPTNIGFVKNFEKCLSYCNGDFIALSDQDDIWKPTKIETLIQNIGNNSLICSDASLIDSFDQVFAESFREYSNIVIPQYPVTLKNLLFTNYVTGCTALFKKELLKTALPFPEGERYHDWWLAIIAAKVNGICYLQAPLVLYRQHSHNDTGAPGTPSLKEKLFGFLKRWQNLNLSIKKKYAHMQQQRLKSHLKSSLFTSEELKLIQNAFYYYQSLCDSFFHPRAFIIAAQQLHLIHPDQKGFFLLKAWLGDLIG